MKSETIFGVPKNLPGDLVHEWIQMKSRIAELAESRAEIVSQRNECVKRIKELEEQIAYLVGDAKGIK